MIHIFKSSNNQFCVVTKAGNGEVLNVTETFTQKKNAWKNILSNARVFNNSSAFFEVQDDTLKGESKVYFCMINAGDFFKRDGNRKPLPKHSSKS